MKMEIALLLVEDCDDSAAGLGSIFEDGDCDDVLSADDCDDQNNTLGAVSEDTDYDGAITSEDCDDTDSESTVVAEDGDCDGTLSVDDCDDADPVLNELDFDGDGKPELFMGADIPGEVESSGMAYNFNSESLLDGSLQSVADADYIFVGEDSQNYLSCGMKNIGDVNGDGVDDLIIAAFGYQEFTAWAYLVYGPSTE